MKEAELLKQKDQEIEEIFLEKIEDLWPGLKRRRVAAEIGLPQGRRAFKNPRC